MMGPANDTPDRPSGELAAAIDEYFGSFEAFQKHFTAPRPGCKARAGRCWLGTVWQVARHLPTV
ncbi:Fe-Mn family superoxide dismutase [Mobiluncus curtisii]|uniref:Superoxide dismutase [Mn/Fe] n=1 Tax=Mobiluncus curtisii TaxID=2051 RepID=A0A2X3BDH2_9ACTO|nr:Fe-Mn family superoxide dismutase [Mobiluncus curtisii]SQC01682.1 Superoxide dismutase [Mn/Fe] [Mobiluncus curtisii]